MTWIILWIAVCFVAELISHAYSISQTKAAVRAANDSVAIWQDRASEWRQLYLEERAHVTELTIKATTPLVVRSNGSLVPFDASTAHDDADDALDDPPTVAEADKAAWLAARQAQEREEQASLDGRLPIPITDADATPPVRLTDAHHDVDEEDDAPDAHGDA